MTVLRRARRGDPRARRGTVSVLGMLMMTVVVASGCSASPGVEASGSPDPDVAATASPSAEIALPAPSATAPSATAPPAPAPPEPAPLAQGLTPSTVTIPAIELSEPLIDLGLQRNGSMEVPQDFGDVGWFTGGGRPGGIGPTVIAAHVDSSVGPAIFFRLRDLVIGDQVQVTDAAGAVFDYVVYEVGDYPKADFPTTRVFGAVATDEVRLITCTGLFDSSIGHYEDNRVVFAKRA